MIITVLLHKEIQMQTAVVGFPRIGTLRELKFTLEKYFRNEISQEELEQKAAELRRIHWQTQQQAGIDYIPSGDFSYYDNVLDAAFLFNIVPERYKKLNRSPLDTYLAMARGYQGESGDVRALAMKKWFNTNYHYIVPEVEDQTEIKLTGDRLFKLAAEASALGIKTKSVIVGPFTLFSLCRFTGSRTAESFVDEFIAAYRELVEKAGTCGIETLQFDEPSLVQDLSADQIAMFRKIYTALLGAAKNTKIFLQTYFGDVRDIYPELIKLPFAGIGLDFIEGRQTLSLIEKYGFPQDQILFAGLVNGKNIWRNNYSRTLEVLKKLAAKGINTVVSTSCSLLHVPYTVKHETRLGAEYLKHLAFAEEKLVELADLGRLASLDAFENDPAFAANSRLFTEERCAANPAVASRMASVTADDYVRKPSREERRKIQKEKFGLPLFPTTTIGSFPQTKEIKSVRAEYRAGRMTTEDYETFIREKIAECIKWQEEHGLDVLVHGEYERNDMVEYFGESLGGFIFTEKAWVQSYGTRCVKPPVIWGDVYRIRPITVEWSKFAQSLTSKYVKGMLTGPVTILNWSFPREDISIRESISQIALAIRDEVLDLEAAGIKIIQIDEAALREKLPLRKSDWNSEYLDFAIPAFRLTHSGVKADTQIHTHMCYSEFTDIIPAIDNMDADVITFEASRSDLQILDSLRDSNFETEVGPGVYDIHSPRIPSVEEIVTACRKMLSRIPADRLWINPDCGLKTRGTPETEASLINLVAAAKELRAG